MKLYKLTKQIREYEDKVLHLLPQDLVPIINDESTSKDLQFYLKLLKGTYMGLFGLSPITETLVAKSILLVYMEFKPAEYAELSINLIPIIYTLEKYALQINNAEVNSKILNDTVYFNYYMKIYK
jgi:hypothetical protein